MLELRSSGGGLRGWCMGAFPWNWLLKFKRTAGPGKFWKFNFEERGEVVHPWLWGTLGFASPARGARAERASVGASFSLRFLLCRARDAQAAQLSASCNLLESPLPPVWAGLVKVKTLREAVLLFPTVRLVSGSGVCGPISQHSPWPSALVSAGEVPGWGFGQRGKAWAAGK